MEDKEEKIIKFIEDFGCCKEEQKKMFSCVLCKYML